jgi:hypothetical protein
MKSEKGQDGHDHHDQADQIDKRVHRESSSAPKQGKQDDDGKRHTQQPQQKSATKAHCIHSDLVSGLNVAVRTRFPSARNFDTCARLSEEMAYVPEH